MIAILSIPELYTIVLHEHVQCFAIILHKRNAKLVQMYNFLSITGINIKTIMNVHPWHYFIVVIHQP